MKAIAIDQYGPLTNLHEVQLPTPQIGADEVLVQVKATSVNPIDWKARQGLLQDMFSWDFPVVLGWDLSGVIIQTGQDVTQFKVGDEVFARPDIDKDGRRGTYADYAAVKEDKLALKPKNVSFEDAAAIPLAGLTAWQVVVDRLHVKRGDKILVQAGAGGVGLFAIQIARYLGAYVATTASAENRQFLLDLGADEVIDYHQQKITDVLKDYDAVFDTVGDLTGGLAILKPTGKLVTIVGQPKKSEQPMAESWWLQPNGQELKKLGELVSQGHIKVILDETLPLNEAGVQAAHRRSEGHHARGKIVLVN
ncbi:MULTISPECIES: NADP-dependent oxidoreductase [Lacticaseibacillus]|uniref:NADP-dependent oxidoreductase n=1 Tax=Lacticaseibacillus TaxID=2759736 RepID=UPI00063DB184|nr:MULTISPECIES: NADP-dependent oxidoreductase [Lacticaseibacillus]KLI77129.1 NADPH:quinone reductase [Lacticaseibacillus casei]